jgi:hypothetical protein
VHVWQWVARQTQQTVTQTFLVPDTHTNGANVVSRDLYTALLAP